MLRARSETARRTALILSLGSMGACIASVAGYYHRPAVQAAADKLAVVQFRKLGHSDISVSEISLGSWLTYSGGVAREQARACVEAAFDAGINFIDTANVYGRGAAESLLGEVLAAHERSSHVLATKLYFPMSQTDRGLA